MVHSVRRLGVVQLAALAFFTVSGGPYGLEPLVGAVGFSGAILLLFLTPLIFAVPISLTVAELASMMPENGGYYRWVKRALGPFWAVQEGVWTMVYCVVDLSLYPVMFVTYLSYFFPYLNPEQGHPWARWLVCLTIILMALAINWRGAPAVADSAAVSCLLVASPFVILILCAVLSPGPWPNPWVSDGVHSNTPAALSAGLATVLWNFSGWDNVSTYANEVAEPSRTFPRALAITVLVVTGCYFLTIVCGCKVTLDPEVWSENQGFPMVGRLAGGPALGSLFASLAVLTSFMMLVAQFLYVPRIPSALANDGFLPQVLATRDESHPPHGALIMTAVMAAVMASLSFGKLVVIDIILYGLALSLECVSLVVLRLREPEAPRPFRVPLPTVLLAVLVSLPILAVGCVAYREVAQARLSSQLLIVLSAILLGPVLYWLGEAFFQVERLRTHVGIFQSRLSLLATSNFQLLR